MQNEISPRPLCFGEGKELTLKENKTKREVNKLPGLRGDVTAPCLGEGRGIEGEGGQPAGPGEGMVRLPGCWW